MGWIEEVIVLFAMNNYALTFFGALIIGEEAVFLLSILAGGGRIPIWTVIILGFLGLVIADSIWFLIGKTKLARFVRSKAHGTQSYRKLQEIDGTLKAKSELLALFLSKFLYGIRFAKLLSLSANGMRYKKFIKMNIKAILLWMVVMITLGWAAGKGLSSIIRVVDNIEMLVEIFVIFFALIVIIEILARVVIKKLSKPKKSVKNK